MITQSHAKRVRSTELGDPEATLDVGAEQPRVDQRKAGTGTPAASTSNTALFGNGSSPLPTIAFSLILLASLGGLAYANVKTVRNRS